MRLKRLPPPTTISPLGTTVSGLTFYYMSFATERARLADDGIRICIRRHRFPLSHCLMLE